MTGVTSLRSCKVKGGHLEYSRVMCYNENISRNDAEDYLRGMPAGSYIVRPCSGGENKLSLSVVSEDNTLNHYLIRLEKGYKLEGRTDRFCCLKSFLKAHSLYYLGLQVKLRTPIFARSMFHMIEIWEYETNKGRWEGFSLEQTYRLATLRRTVNPVYKFEDSSIVNIEFMTREVPCIYGVQTQQVRMKTLYGLCEKCSFRSVHPTLKHSQNKKANDRSHYSVWEYYDGSEWRCFEYGKSSFQHFLASFAVLCENGSVKDKKETIRDSYGNQWYIDLVNSKIVNVSGMKTYSIRKREVHGISCNDTHQERERYMSRDQNKISHVLERMYCESESAVPPTWTSKRSHVLSPSSEEHKYVSAQIPSSQRNHISSIVRIQDSDSWRIFSKEHQLLSLSTDALKIDLFWSSSRILAEHEPFDRSRLETSMTNHECFYFDRHLKEKQSVKTLVLCKVVYDPSDGQCVVDDQYHASTLHMDVRHKDAVVPLFLVFFSQSLNNTTSSSCSKNTENKTVPLQITN